MAKPGDDLLPALTGPWLGDRATRVRLVTAEGKFPLRRIEEILARTPAGITVVSQREMVADHVMVSMRPGQEGALAAAVATAGCTLRRTIPGSSVVLV